MVKSKEIWIKKQTITYIKTDKLSERSCAVRFPGKGKDYMFSTASAPALGSTESPIQWIPGALSPRVKRPGREADHSPPSRAACRCNCTPPYGIMAWCRLGIGTALPWLWQVKQKWSSKLNLSTNELHILVSIGWIQCALEFLSCLLHLPGFALTSGLSSTGFSFIT
jgi:hypothetical protein